MRLTIAAAAVAAASCASLVALAVSATPAGASPAFHLAWLRTTPGHIGRSAPVAVSLTSNHYPSVVVGDTTGHLYGFALSDGVSPAGWGNIRTTGPSIDAALSTDGNGHIFIPETSPHTQPVLNEYSVAGTRIWGVHGCPSTKCDQLGGMAVGPGGTTVYVGGLQYYYGVPTSNGQGGWSYQNSDSTNSTPAVANLTGSGPVVITANDQTPNATVGALSGGHLRITTPRGQPLCDANIGGGPAAPGSFDSSPAVASFGGSPVIVLGSGASGTLVNQMMGYNAACQRVWLSAKLAGQTVGAPAIADVLGTRRPVVVEEVATAGRNPVVYEIDGATGGVLRSATVKDSKGNVCTNFTQGTASSVVTADLTNSGHQDLLVPAGSCGVIALDGRTLGFLGQMGNSCAVQNTPVVTTDPGGSLGITMAGYRAKAGGGSEGCVFHYTVAGGATGLLGWPMFHHDPQLTGSLTSTFPQRDAMYSHQALLSGQSLVSSNGLYKATMLVGGTFAVYQRSSLSVRWQKAVNSPGAVLTVADNYLYAKSKTGTVLWKTPAYTAKAPMTLVLSPAGKLMLNVHNGNEWAKDITLWSA